MIIIVKYIYYESAVIMMQSLTTPS